MTVIRFPRLWRGAEVTQPTGKLRAWLTAHRTSMWVVVGLLLVVGLLHGINFDGYPGRNNDDEGTYAAQAWAILARGELTHYTYWYDHPPFGWMQIAAYAWLTNGFDRAVAAVTVGREFMLIADLFSAALMYLLARRLGFHRVTASATVLLFAASPVALFYHRMVFLDNIAVTWLLGSLVFAASPRRSLGAAFGSALCFTSAVLTKETILILLPVVIWLLLQHQVKSGRAWSLGVFASSLIGASLFYPLYALLKSELLAGPGHVSLEDAIRWQLFERESSGSVFDPTSVARATVDWWLSLDPFLLSTGAALVVPALFIRRLRPFAVALGIQLALMLRDGYLPQPYIVSLVPFAALLLAGLAEAAWRSQMFKVAVVRSKSVWSRLWHGVKLGVNRTGAMIVIVVAALFSVEVAPVWADNIHTAATTDQGRYSHETTQWILENIPKDATIVVDDNTWTDLTRAGYTKVIWIFKVDLDPAVNAEFLPNGYKDIDYVVRLPLSERIFDGIPTVRDALQHSKVVARFGHDDVLMRIHKVKK